MRPLAPVADTVVAAAAVATRVRPGGISSTLDNRRAKTISGHHHCNAHSPGCACTDPKKCAGKAGTGSPYCAANPAECLPIAGQDQCFAYYSGDVKYCGDCPSGTGSGNCAGKGSGAANPGGGGGAATTTTTSAGDGGAAGGGGGSLTDTLKQNWIILVAAAILLFLIMRR
jgi:hypothetical protein